MWKTPTDWIANSIAAFTNSFTQETRQFSEPQILVCVEIMQKISLNGNDSKEMPLYYSAAGRMKKKSLVFVGKNRMFSESNCLDRRYAQAIFCADLLWILEPPLISFVSFKLNLYVLRID